MAQPPVRVDSPLWAPTCWKQTAAFIWDYLVFPLSLIVLGFRTLLSKIFIWAGSHLEEKDEPNGVSDPFYTRRIQTADGNTFALTAARYVRESPEVTIPYPLLDPNAPTFIYFHGIGNRRPKILEGLLQMVPEVPCSRFNWVECSYRGKDGSEGMSDFEKLVLDGDSVVRYLQQSEKIAYDKMTLVGMSFGTSVATRVALEHPQIPRLLLFAGFSNFFTLFFYHLFVTAPKLLWRCSWWLIILFSLACLVALPIVVVVLPFILLALATDWNFNTAHNLKLLAAKAPAQQRLVFNCRGDELVGPALLIDSPEVRESATVCEQRERSTEDFTFGACGKPLCWNHRGMNGDEPELLPLFADL